MGDKLSLEGDILYLHMNNQNNYIVPFPYLISNHNYCLVAIDHFSKFISVVPLVKKTSIAVANALKYKLLPFLTYIPDRLFNDRGLKFMDKPFEEVLREFGILYVVISNNIHQCNRVTARVNRRLLQTFENVGWFLSSGILNCSKLLFCTIIHIALDH